jgi:hypothetical protein
MSTLSSNFPRVTGTASLVLIVVPTAIYFTPFGNAPADFSNRLAPIPSLNDFAKKFGAYGAGINELSRIQEIESLEDNWNGYGAKAIERDILDKGRLLIYELHRRSISADAFPTQRSTLQIEYKNNYGTYFEIEIGKTEYHIAIIKPEGDEEFSSTSIDEIISKVS